MTMTAKFDGRCKRCSAMMLTGTKIYWTRGYGAVHANAAGCDSERSTPKPVAVDAPVVNATGIVGFLTAAKARGLKFPKARFLTSTGEQISLAMAGSTSRYPGAVQVKVAGEWVGRIEATGAAVGKLAHDMSLLSTLGTISENPAVAAKAYAALTCSCSFCNLKLTDAGSVEVGYGPICAGHWGLPHTPKGTPSMQVVAA